MAEEQREREIYTYTAPWTIFSLGWSQRPGDPYRFRIAAGSFLEEYSNEIQVVQRGADGEFHKLADFAHPYPATKIMWAPQRYQGAKDLLATSADYLRLWAVSDDGSRVEDVALLNTNRNTEYCAPLTSFDWCEDDPSLICTSSIDTTCTLWDIEQLLPKTQLIAHDKEVYDVAFAQGRDIFASAGGDGSVRIFDARSLEHSTIVYESHDLSPLLRLAWNRQDSNYLATILTDSPQTVILDVRVPAIPVARLQSHQAAVNGVAWAPHSSCHICTVSDDRQAFIWNLSQLPQPIADPVLAYCAEGSINQLQWSASHEDWVAIAFGEKLQLLKV